MTETMTMTMEEKAMVGWCARCLSEPVCVPRWDKHGGRGLWGWCRLAEGWWVAGVRATREGVCGALPLTDATALRAG